MSAITTIKFKFGKHVHSKLGLKEHRVYCNGSGWIHSILLALGITKPTKTVKHPSAIDMKLDELMRSYAFAYTDDPDIMRTTTRISSGCPGTFNAFEGIAHYLNINIVIWEDMSLFFTKKEQNVVLVNSNAEANTVKMNLMSIYELSMQTNVIHIMWSANDDRTSRSFLSNKMRARTMDKRVKKCLTTIVASENAMHRMLYYEETQWECFEDSYRSDILSKRMTFDDDACLTDYLRETSNAGYDCLTIGHMSGETFFAAGKLTCRLDDTMFLEPSGFECKVYVRRRENDRVTSKSLKDTINGMQFCVCKRQFAVKDERMIKCIKCGGIHHMKCVSSNEGFDQNNFVCSRC